MHLSPFLALWLLLLGAVIVLALWRRSVSVNENDALHLGAAGLGTPAQQLAMAQRLEFIDKWGKLLTVIAAIAGLLLAAAYLYKGWVQGSGVSGL